MMFLKQSTAIEVKIGPFVDQTDGFTAETGLTLAQADIRLAKEEGDWAQKNEATTAAAEENGWYRCLLDATDTNTVGRLYLAVNESGALPVWHEFMVLAANVYDSLIGGTDALQVHANEITAGLITAAAIATGAIDADAIAADAITAAKVADGTIDAATFAAGAINAAAIATDAIDGDAIAASAVTEIQAGLATSAALTTVQADTDDIQTRLPAALVGGRMDSSVGAMAADVVTASAIAAGAIGASEAPNLDAAVSSRAVAGDAMTLTAGERTSIANALLDLANGVETSYTVRQALRLMAAALCGKISGEPGAPVIRDLGDTANRITAVVDSNGNRTSVTLAPS